MKQRLTCLLGILFLILGACSPQRQLLVNAGLDFGFDQLQKAHPGGIIKIPLQRNEFEYFRTPWGFIDYQIVILKDTIQNLDSLIIPYHINYPVVKDSAKSFIHKILNQKKMKKSKEQAMLQIYETNLWMLEQRFFERMVPVVLHRDTDQGPWLYWDDEEDEGDEDPFMADVKDGIKTITCSGTMSPDGGWSSRGFKAMIADIKACEEAERVKAILFDVNTNGGSAEGIQELYQAVANCSKPTAAICNNKMNSAGYYGFCGADRIYTNTLETSFMGSIGVFLVHGDYSKWNEEKGVKYTYVTATKSTEKVIGHEDKPLSKNDEEFIRERVDKINEAFIRDVLAARPGVPEEAFTGKAFDGQDSLRLGLCDAQGDINQARQYLLNQIKMQELNLA